MKPKELENLVRFIRNSFGKTMVGDEIMDFLIEQVSHIPSEAAKWIGEEVVRRNQKSPEVLHIAILSAWYAWRAQHPEKCGPEPGKKDGCANDNCVDGWMVFWARHRDRLYSFVVPCGDCRQLGNTDIPAMRMDRCKAKGWIPDSHEIQAQYQEEIREDVEARREEYRIRGRHRLIEERMAG